MTLSIGFPDGGPPDTCVKERFNQPNHGKARTQPIDTLPYEVRATADNYQPGQQVQGMNYCLRKKSSDLNLMCFLVC